MELRSRANVVAVQVWQEEDIRNAFETQVDVSEAPQEMVDEVSARASDQLEDCSHGWDILYGIVDKVFVEFEDEFEDEDEDDEDD